MSDRSFDASTPDLGRDTAKTAFAAGGLLAAFGVASCCALPIALSALGISAVSLTGIGFVAAPYQRELFFVAIALIAAAGILMRRQRAMRACAPGSGCSRPVLDWIVSIGMIKAVALLALAGWIEPPV